MSVVSCGIVLLNPRFEIFTCRATGTTRWDLPKGVGDPGETPRDAAVREAWEESGLRVPPEPLRDLGEFAYLPGKRLHLFAARVAVDVFDIAGCRCRSYFEHHRTGRPTPEADAFAWQSLENMTVWGGKGLQKVLSQLAWRQMETWPALARIEVDTASPVGP